MLRIMRDESTDDERRDRMAVAAAAFLHPKLASTTMDVRATMTWEEALRAVAGEH